MIIIKSMFGFGEECSALGLAVKEIFNIEGGSKRSMHVSL